MNKEIEVLRKIYNEVDKIIKSCCWDKKPYAELNAKRNTLASAIKLMTEVERVEEILPKEEDYGYPAVRDTHNACLHQVKLNLAKAGLCKKPSVEEIEKIMSKMTEDPTLLEGYIPRFSPAIAKMLEGER